MTDKERQYLIAEIERLKDCASPIVVCDTLLSLIDSMQEEPVSEELEKEFSRFLDEKEGMPRMRRSEEQLEWALDIACHFAEWQRQKDEHLVWQISSANYEKGKQEAKDQMMKDAVEGHIFPNDGEIWVDNEILRKYSSVDNEDIKLIIIKEN